ncbi:eCIS core domain-containing protein [Massilia endophytica]|uniref:eCIS core domain-containing protein n=1 Tax=Massilia endophytica TaxID=2899220 RepID=UPI001E4E38B5|nr:DUF4157 domain-containing protein [Massilia endophytica]UGQ48475.1 DUF4157 domain-containing protein [Massilia endophytica]
MQAPLQAKSSADIVQTKTAKAARQDLGRPAAPAQRTLAEMSNNSPRVLQQRALSDAAQNSPRMAAQRQETNALFGAKPGAGALPAQLKAGIEALSGISMDDVRVHANSSKPAQFQAHAYAQGTDIHLAPGQEKHLPHEAWHVVQQKQGRVKPTMQMKGKVGVNDDASLEREADVMGSRAMQFASAKPSAQVQKTAQTNPDGTIQYKRTEMGPPLYTDTAFEPPVKDKTSAAPRIVMTFGNNVAQLDQLIAEHKASAEAMLNPKYAIGVNVGPTDIKATKDGPKPPTMKDAEAAAQQLFDSAKSVGMTVIPFTWAAGEARGKMYEFPYFEARSMLMKAASAMGTAVPGTVYAMTDRDARESTGIDPKHIAAARIDKQLDSSMPTLVSGPYDWREENPDNPLLDSIIFAVNTAETEFRHWKVQRGLYSYMPEPNMFFNQKGLEVAIKNLDAQELGGQQAKESEAIRSDGIKTRYNKHATVTKPAKRFPNKQNYLHGVYELLHSLGPMHQAVSADEVQDMFDKIIQSELSRSNVREMTHNSDAAAAKALEIMDNTASVINKIIAIR